MPSPTFESVDTFPEAATARSALSEADWVHAAVLFSRPGRRVRMLYGAAVVLALALAAWGALSGDWRVVATGVGAVAGGAIGHFSMACGAEPGRQRRHFRRTEALRREQRLTPSDAGLHFHFTAADTRLAWSDIRRWRADVRSILVCPTPRAYFVVPTRLAAQGFPIDALRVALAAHAGPAR